MTGPKDEYLTYQEAAERYKVGESTIRYWVNTKRIKRYKRPGDRKVYVCVSDIEQYKNATPTAEEN